MSESNPRVPTGIQGLDQMLGGGLLPQSANLLEGAPGTGKSTCGMQFIYHGIQAYAEHGVIISFEEQPYHYYRDARAFGWDLPELETSNKLRVILSSPEVIWRDIQQTDGKIETAIREIGAKRIVIDSLSHFERLTRNPIELRKATYTFINGLKRLNLTSILTRENAALLGENPEIEEDLAYVADSYIMLRYVEINSMLAKALLILKQRGSNHVKDIRRYDITHQGMVIYEMFEGVQGVMSGMPTMTMREAFEKAFKPPSR